MGRIYETAAPDRYDILKEYARKNRRNPTDSETILWEALRREIKGYKFRRQHPLGDYIVDLVCLPLKLVIEVDREYHDTESQQQADQYRTEFLESKGYCVARFKNAVVNCDVKTVIDRIKDIINKIENNHE